MSLSTWLFGKKKSPSSPLTSENKPLGQAEEADEFVVIERRTQATVITGEDSLNRMYPTYPTLPYSLGPGPSYNPGQPVRSTSQHEMNRMASLDSDKNMLLDVPFKISSDLISNEANNLKDISARASDMLFKVKRLDQRHFEYDFKLEYSVARD